MDRLTQRFKKKPKRGTILEDKSATNNGNTQQGTSTEEQQNTCRASSSKVPGNDGATDGRPPPNGESHDAECPQPLRKTTEGESSTANSDAGVRPSSTGNKSKTVTDAGASRTPKNTTGMNDAERSGGGDEDGDKNESSSKDEPVRCSEKVYDLVTKWLDEQKSESRHSSGETEANEQTNQPPPQCERCERCLLCRAKIWIRRNRRDRDRDRDGDGDGDGANGRNSRNGGDGTNGTNHANTANSTNVGGPCDADKAALRRANH